MKAIFQYGTQEDLPAEVNRNWFWICEHFAKRNGLKVSTGTCYLNLYDKNGRLSDFLTDTEFIFRPSEYKRLPKGTRLVDIQDFYDGSRCYIYIRETKQNET